MERERKSLEEKSIWLGVEWVRLRRVEVVRRRARCAFRVCSRGRRGAGLVLESDFMISLSGFFPFFKSVVVFLEGQLSVI